MNKIFFDKSQVGKKGEDIASNFLVMNGFKLLDRNYSRKWGEIDIVAKKEGAIHFVEVKTVSYETTDYRPEDKVTRWKYKKLARVIQTYLLDKKVPYETDWQIDVIAIFLNFETDEARVRVTSNINFGH